MLALTHYGDAAGVSKAREHRGTVAAARLARASKREHALELHGPRAACLGLGLGLGSGLGSGSGLGLGLDGPRAAVGALRWWGGARLQGGGAVARPRGSTGHSNGHSTGQGVGNRQGSGSNPNPNPNPDPDPNPNPNPNPKQAGQRPL